MENVFLQYMNDRMKIENEPDREPGPVITLSREYGCYASRVAQLLSERLTAINEKNHTGKRWSVISNEVLEEAARKLEVEPKAISHIFGADEKRFLGDIIESFSTKKYASDSNIKHTITTIVRSYAEQGNVIVVGRAGCVITRHISKALHLKIVAPREWRVHRIMERFNINSIAASKLVEESDDKRRVFMSFFKGDKPDCELFDIVLNRAKLSEQEIVDTIMNLVIARKLV